MEKITTVQRNRKVWLEQERVWLTAPQFISISYSFFTPIAFLISYSHVASIKIDSFTFEAVWVIIRMFEEHQHGQQAQVEILDIRPSGKALNFQ